MRQAVSEMEDAAKRLIKVLQDIEDMGKGVDVNLKEEPRNLLLSTLMVCGYTEGNKAAFLTPEVRNTFTEIVEEDPRMRTAALELLKKFGPGEYRFYVCDSRATN